eukprot:238493-Prorocentrum_minimum.AAC.1
MTDLGVLGALFQTDWSAVRIYLRFLRLIGRCCVGRCAGAEVKGGRPGAEAAGGGAKPRGAPQKVRVCSQERRQRHGAARYRQGEFRSEGFSSFGPPPTPVGARHGRLVSGRLAGLRVSAGQARMTAEGGRGSLAGCDTRVTDGDAGFVAQNEAKRLEAVVKEKSTINQTNREQAAGYKEAVDDLKMQVGVERTLVRVINSTTCYGSSCANNGKAALNTPETLPLFSPCACVLNSPLRALNSPLP